MSDEDIIIIYSFWFHICRLFIYFKVLSHTFHSENNSMSDEDVIISQLTDDEKKQIC